MDKIVRQENELNNELNLVVGARKIVSKLGPRKFAATLMLSSMIVAFTGCGKKDEVTQQDAKYRNRALGGTIVDNHNKELYIAGASDIESVVNDVNNVEDNTKKSEGSSNTQSSSTASATSTSSTTTTTSPTTNEVVVGTTSNATEVPAPNLLPGETVIYSPDGGYVVIPSQDYVNPPEGEQAPAPENPSTGEPSVGEPPLPPEVEEPPVVEEENNGYVVLKKNYPDDTYFYVFTNNNGSYNVQLIDVNYANAININSDIYALAKDEDAYAYALNNNWAGVGQYNRENWGLLDSVYNMEEVCKEIVDAALQAKEEADKDAAKGLGLGL